MNLAVRRLIGAVRHQVQHRSHAASNQPDIEAVV